MQRVSFEVRYVFRFYSEENQSLYTLNVYLVYFLSFTFSQMYLYQKDEWALPGNLQNRKNILSPPPPLNMVPLNTLQFLHLSVFLLFFTINIALFQ
jgi:hypothetical protein